MALIYLIADGDLHVVYAVFADAEGQAVDATLGPEMLHIVQLGKAHRRKLCRANLFDKGFAVPDYRLRRHGLIRRSAAALY